MPNLLFKFYKPDLINVSLFFSLSTFLQIPQNVLRRAQYAFQKKQICLPGLFIGSSLRPFLSWSSFSTRVFMSCLTPRSVRRRWSINLLPAVLTIFTFRWQKRPEMIIDHRLISHPGQREKNKLQFRDYLKLLSLITLFIFVSFLESFCPDSVPEHQQHLVWELSPIQPMDFTVV